jgi:hypothetical protein
MRWGLQSRCFTWNHSSLTRLSVFHVKHRRLMSFTGTWRLVFRPGWPGEDILHMFLKADAGVLPERLNARDLQAQGGSALSAGPCSSIQRTISAKMAAPWSRPCLV